MNLVNDIPITSGGIFIYNLNISKDYKKYYTSLKYDSDPDSQQSKDKSVLKNLSEIEKEINLACCHFIKEILHMECDYFIFNSWFTLTKPKKESHSHIHSNSWLSGVYYPEEHKGFNIRFYNDNINVFYTDVKSYNIYNTKYWTITPKKNQLVLFHSGIRHKIIKNESNKNRYSLAFNLLPKGVFGFLDSKVNFKF
jgi:uncharacterized protein (TIGR02466 family)